MINKPNFYQNQICLPFLPVLCHFFYRKIPLNCAYVNVCFVDTNVDEDVIILIFIVVPALNSTLSSVNAKTSLVQMQYLGIQERLMRLELKAREEELELERKEFADGEATNLHPGGGKVHSVEEETGKRKAQGT